MMAVTSSVAFGDMQEIANPEQTIIDPEQVIVDPDDQQVTDPAQQCATQPE